MSRVLIALGCGLLALSACKKDEEPPPATTDSLPTTVPPRNVIVEVGTPMWQVSEIVVFTGPAGDGTQTCLLDGNHVWDGTVWSPGTAHEPPYDTEIRDALSGCGLTEKDTFDAADLQDPNGIWLALIVEAKAGNAPGSSKDFPLGDVIYDDRFPMVVDADVRRDSLIVDSDNDFIYPKPGTWGDVVTGMSHVPLVFRTTHERMPAGASPGGSYAWHVLLRDDTSVVQESGWDLEIPYTVLPVPE